MAKNSDEFLKFVEVIKKERSDFLKLPVEEQQRMRDEKKVLLKKMASSPPKFND